MSTSKKVYIADDSVVTRMFISSIVNEIPNTEIRQFMNGQEVVDAVKETIPDLLILDSVMPVLDGIGVLAQLKEMNTEFPVIFCTADIQASTKEKTLGYGIAEFVNKPIDKELLRNTIINILNI